MIILNGKSSRGVLGSPPDTVNIPHVDSSVTATAGALTCAVSFEGHYYTG